VTDDIASAPPSGTPANPAIASIAERLNGTRIAITGSTGFLGTALVERLLRSVPGCELVLVVRSGKRTPAAERIRREVIRNDAFDRLREELGDQFQTDMDRRVIVIDGDVSRD
jgi:alcohol-forming fatty acyl-CoA reductase